MYGVTADHIWEQSRNTSSAYWNFYEKLIGPINRISDVNTLVIPVCDNKVQEEDNRAEDHSLNQVNNEYLEFIRVTREHQAERERLKQLELKKSKYELEEYYVDISQVNTLVQDNLVDVPSIEDNNQQSHDEVERNLIDFYGGREKYDKIRSMEMYIDEHFNQKCKEFKPQFWPIIPLNPKPYLNEYK